MATPKILIDHERLVVNGRAFARADIRNAAAEQRGASVVWPASIGAVAGMVVIPLLIVQLSQGRSADVEQLLFLGLFIAALALFSSIGFLLFSEERYCLVLETSAGKTVALESDDSQLIVSVVARLNDRRMAERPALQLVRQ